MTSSKRLGTCRMQSSTVTRAMATSDVPGAGGYTRAPQKGKGSDALNSLVGRQPGQENPYGRAADRMTPVGREIRKRPQDKGPILQPGVRQDRPAGPAGGNLSLEIKEIEVDQAGG